LGKREIIQKSTSSDFRHENDIFRCSFSPYDPKIKDFKKNITIICKIKSCHGVLNIIEPEPILKSIPIISTLTKDLTAAKKNSDFTIKVDDVQFPINTFILAARSDVFSRLFSTEMIERAESVLHIEDVKPEVVEEFIYYIYNDTTSKLKLFPLELYIIADKYNVKGLKMLAEEELINTMSVNNVLSILFVADGSENIRLKIHALKFTARFFTYLKRDGKWDELKKKTYTNGRTSILYTWT
jgi:hypothetical protein